MEERSNYKRKKQDQDDEAKQGERDAMYKLNQQWLEEQEAYNLGSNRLPRNGDHSVYTNTGIGKNPDGTACAIPSGLPIPFGDPNFQQKFRNSEDLKACFPNWDFSCKHKQDLSDPPADPQRVSEVLRACIEKLKKSGGIRTSSVYERNL